jgi:hypothetical protein
VDPISIIVILVLIWLAWWLLSKLFTSGKPNASASAPTWQPEAPSPAAVVSPAERLEREERALRTAGYTTKLGEVPLGPNGQPRLTRWGEIAHDMCLVAGTALTIADGTARMAWIYFVVKDGDGFPSVPPEVRAELMPSQADGRAARREVSVTSAALAGWKSTTSFSTIAAEVMATIGRNPEIRIGQITQPRLDAFGELIISNDADARRPGANKARQ